MKKVSCAFDFFDEGLYDIGDIILQFEQYFGMNFYYLNEFFKDSTVIEKKKLIDRLEFCQSNYQFRVLDVNYNYLVKKIQILRKKGQVYLLLLEYLKKTSNKNFHVNSCYEEKLNACGIFHFRSVLMGRDIKKILNALGNTFNQLIDCLVAIESPKTYAFPRIDSFSVFYEKNRSYPNLDIVLKSTDLFDETSIVPKRLKKTSNH